MNNKQINFVKIVGKMVTGYRAYGKMGIAVGTIFNFVELTETHLVISEVGFPNCKIPLNIEQLYKMENFELLNHLNGENYERLVSDMNAYVQYKNELEAFTANNNRVIQKMIDSLPKYQPKRY